MAEQEVHSRHERRARFRFGVIGPLLSAPPTGRGDLKRELKRLASKTWTDPIHGEPVSFGVSTIERWYYLARGAANPVKALWKKVRKDRGLRRSLSEAAKRAVHVQHRDHPGWTKQLHYDNLLAMGVEEKALRPLPSYSYPSFRIFEKLLQTGCHFVIRSPKSQTFKEVQSFVQSGRKEGWVTLYPPSGYPDPAATPIKLRIAVFREFSDDPIVLLTDLDSRSLTRQDLLAIYRLRWKIEELYGLVQGDCLGQRQYHATTPEGIMQEVFALALLINLVRSCASAAADQHGVPYQQLCEKEAVLATASYLTRLLLEADLDVLRQIFDRLLRRIGTCTYKPRTGRSHPRRSYKPRSKWCATGKRGEK